MLDRLPIIVLDQIVDQLSYLDIFHLKLTCKSLKNQLNPLFPSTATRDLIVYVENNPNYNNLFYTDELVYYSKSIRIERSRLLKKKKFQEKFRHLKKLVIYYFSIYISNQATYDLSIDLSNLNYFEDLELVEISKFNIVNGRLTLKNLKICRIDASRVSKFELKTDQLKALCIEDGARPELIGKTDNLTYLQSTFVFDDKYLVQLFSKCKSLTTVCSNKIETLELVLLKINRGFLDLPVNEFRVESVFEFKNDTLIVELMVLKQKRKDLKFYFNNKFIKLDDLVNINTFSNYKEFVVVTQMFKSQLKFFNYDYLLCLDSKPGFEFLFQSIRNCIIDREDVDERLIGKLVNLRRCMITDVRLNDRMIDCIMSNCIKLVFLIFERVELDRDQLDRLADRMVNLRYIKIRSCDLTSIKFLTKFTNLQLASLDTLLQRHHFRYLVQHSPQLQLTFPKKYSETEFIAIKPLLKRFSFYLIRDGRSEFVFANLDDLLNLFYSKKWLNQIDFTAVLE